MIISHEHKFIFLKTRKTAGTSIELALSQLCGPDDIITPISPNDEPFRANGRGPQNWRRHSWWQSKRPLFQRYWFQVYAGDYGFYNHMPATEARALLNDDKIWRSYFKFAFERNPWDRQVSAYHFRYRRAKNPPPFSSYMQRKRRAWINNYEIYSIDGAACVDFVGRFENLTEDFRKALKQVGVDFDQELPRAKANFRRTQKHYRDYYDEETRGIVNDWYAPEINLLGYEF
ncbi:MAG: sulfotransferase family 2 domain-containing protein [Methyloceanibacter sp.]